MPTFTEVLPQGKNKRRPAMEWQPLANPVGYAIGHLTIHVDRATVEYRVDHFPADDCIGICLVKMGPGTDKEESSYCIEVAPGRPPSCCCKGFVRFAKCKHSDAISAMIENKWL